MSFGLRGFPVAAEPAGETTGAGGAGEVFCVAPSPYATRQS